MTASAHAAAPVRAGPGPAWAAARTRVGLVALLFVLAAVGWRYKKVGLIAVGLALWMASILVTLVIH